MLAFPIAPTPSPNTHGSVGAKGRGGFKKKKESLRGILHNAKEWSVKK